MAYLTFRPTRVTHAPSGRRRIFGPRRSASPGGTVRRDDTAQSTDPVPATRFTGPGTADPAEADEFLRQYHRERANRAGPLLPRLRAVQREIAETGTYTHTPAELTYGAQVAWRNSSRCIGRLYWQSLKVLDRRAVTGADAIAHHLAEHLRSATNNGWVRPTISVFAPDAPGRPGPRVWNEQLIRYAGYPLPDGRVVGDRRYVGFTALVRALGWLGAGSHFDLLPLVVEEAGAPPRLYDVPRDAVLEVPLSHPEYAWFADLGLRWHAVPVISHMRLRIGGIDYPLAPFNGWYMGTEIGARNLADADRYDLLPEVAARLRLDTANESSLWRDRALVELNVAVLSSFQRAGVRIADHHSASRDFLVHLDREHRAGRITPADWTWIVPPMSGAATPVFHRYYDQADLRPNFYLDDAAAARAFGTAGCPVAGTGTRLRPAGCPVPH
jgi:nitric-oxide synthase, bacterial